MTMQTTFLDKLAMTLTIFGVILGVSIAALGPVLNQNLTMHGYGVFVGLSAAAIVLGLTRRSSLGKVAAVSSSALLIGSLCIVA